MPIVARLRLPASAVIVVAKYARVSTAEQLDGFGLEDQNRISNGWLARHPEATVYDHYVDEAVSGALESRPEVDRLVRDARRGCFNRILVPAVDRVGRTARAAYQWAWDMADLGVHFLSASEDIDTSTETGWSRFMRHVTLSEMEWRRIRERTCAGRELKISYGGWPGGPAPFGYRIAKDTTTVGGRQKTFSVLVTDDYESRVLFAATEFIVDRGMNVSEAAEELNARGLLTRSGVPWGAANLRNRLHSETIHRGYVVYRKTNRGAGKNNTRLHEDGSPLHGDPVRMGVPPILSEERARQLMETLRSIGFQNGRINDRIYPLSGRIDSLCGSVYTGMGRGSRKARGYRCKGSVGEGGACQEPHFDAAELEAAVWTQLAELMKDKDQPWARVAECLSSPQGDKEKYEKRVRVLADDIAVREDLIHRQVPAYLAAGIDPLVLKAGLKAMEQELEECRRQKEIAGQWLRAQADHQWQAGKLAALASNASEGLDSMTPDERKELCDFLNVRVTPRAMGKAGRSGIRCEVRAWHHETGTLVPPDPTGEEWEAVMAILRRFLPEKSKKHFISKYDIRVQFSGMLHRLRSGLSWVEMPLIWGPINPMRERQLFWWKRGAWPEIMAVLGADRRGVEAYWHSVLPQLTVTVQPREGLPGQVRSDALDAGTAL
ncbi:recombinase family protein [Streptomyces sp. NPDC097595]|uniref:recombinase family protein n=1 Tax=Streptomyces sp. NPDC097595 TaxID=3366090 RepID=UPI003817382E